MHHNLAYFPYLFAGMAAFFLIIGIRVTIANRPLFLSARYFFIFMLFAILPQAINMTYTYAVSNNLPSKLSPVMLMNPIILICLLVFFWFQMKGYIAIGVTDESFRSALHFSLNKNNLVFEEQLSTIKLIYSSCHPAMGRVRPDKNKKFKKQKFTAAHYIRSE